MSPSVSARLLLTQSDARLVAFARAGHERAFEALVRRYRGPLLGYCRRLLLSDERAEDALQQALMQAWLALRAGTEVQNAKAWLYRIVHNSALNTLRVSGYDYCTLSESLSGADAPQEDLDRRIAVREALAGLAALPEMQREALLRTAVEGSSHREAARELGVSEPALRGLVYRARAALRATAGAIVPAPMVSWALGSGGGAPVSASLAEVGVVGGGGGAGVAGLLMKGGVMAVTAGVLAGGVAAVHGHLKPAGRHPPAHGSHHYIHLQTTRLAFADIHPANVTPVADVQKTSEVARSLPERRSTRRAGRTRGHGHGDRIPEGLHPAVVRARPSPSGGDDRRRKGDGGGPQSRPRNPGTNGVGTGTDVKGGEGGHDGHREPGGDRSRHGDGEGGSSGDGTQRSSPGGRQEDGGGSSGSGDGGDGGAGGSSSGGGGGGYHSGQGEQSADTHGGEESPTDRGPSRATSTNVSPTGEQVPDGGKGE